MTPEQCQEIIRSQGQCGELSPDRKRACILIGEHTHDWTVADMRTPYLPAPEPTAGPASSTMTTSDFLKIEAGIANVREKPGYQRNQLIEDFWSLIEAHRGLLIKLDTLEGQKGPR